MKIDSRANRKRILVCGPIAEAGKPAEGGFQTGNLRLISILREIGFETEGLAYPGRKNSSTAKVWAYMTTFIRIWTRLLQFWRDGDAVHFTPLLKRFLYFEVLVCAFAKLSGKKLVVDLRAGFQYQEYRERSGMYRMAFRWMARLADVVAYEGEVYREWLQKLDSKKPCFYNPNFVQDSYVACPPRAAGGPRLVYVGRVSEAKGCMHGARILTELRQTLPEATLTLVGYGTSEEIEEIHRLASEGVVLTGQLAQDQIREILDQSHFFMFLTLWKSEGHSNALTEAMARGCVPIYTQHGFNSSVAGGVGIEVANRDKVHEVAEAIIRLWLSAQWEELSRQACQRVQREFSEERVRGTVAQIYRTIFCVA